MTINNDIHFPSYRECIVRALKNAFSWQVHIGFAIALWVIYCVNVEDALPFWKIYMIWKLIFLPPIFWIGYFSMLLVQGIINGSYRYFQVRKPSYIKKQQEYEIYKRKKEAESPQK